MDRDVNISFKDPDTGIEIPDEESADFVNEFFATIAERVCKREDAIPYIPGDMVDTVFDFIPPERFDIMLFAESIDTNSSSGIKGINSLICKIILLHILEKIRLSYANSMYSGIFPPD